MSNSRNGVSAEPRIPVLVVSAQNEDCRRMSCILQHPSWNLIPAPTCLDAKRTLASEPVAVVVCEEELPDGSWRDIIETVRATAPNVPVLVMSRRADESLWSDVLDAGGYDCLAKPFQAAEVCRLLRLAWQCWSGALRSMREPYTQAAALA